MTTKVKADKKSSVMQRVLPVLHEDAQLLAVGKPAGVNAGGRKDEGLEGIVELLAALRNEPDLQPINRLSRYESGVLLIARDPAMVDMLRGRLREGAFELEYLAVVCADVSRKHMKLQPGSDAGKKPDAKSKGKREKKAVDTPRAEKTDASGFLSALRHGDRRTLVRLKTRLENTHALRAQLRGAKLRLLGDRLKDPSRGKRNQQEETALHLERMRFSLPGVHEPYVLTNKPPRAFAEAVDGNADLTRPLRAGLVRRLPILQKTDTDCYRLLTGDHEDLRDVVVERYGPLLTIEMRSTEPLSRHMLRDIWHYYRSQLDVNCCYSRHVPPPAKRGARNRKDQSDRGWMPMTRRHMDDAFTVQENGLTFEVRLDVGAAPGLFLDQRDNRARVREMAEGKQVLNLFAYTCGFSVAAAMGGAAGTVSVDMSVKHLEWGKRNLALNGVSLDENWFIRSDASDYFKRAKRQGKSFDIVIIDAPTFAHGRKRGESFAIQRDLPGLITGACEVLNPKGVVLVSSNHRKMTPRLMRDLIHRGAGGRRVRVLASPPLPIDFAVDREHACTVIVSLD